MKTIYICFEGSEGVGKTTQVTETVNYLRSLGYKVLETKEPGTIHSPLTMSLRRLMLDSKYEDQNKAEELKQDLMAVLANSEFHPHLTEKSEELLQEAVRIVGYEKQMTKEARELICQAIRHIHINKVIIPAHQEYDFIVQDRGILSGLAYGVAGGVDLKFMNNLNTLAVADLEKGSRECYDHVILLQANVANGLKRALSAKQEFESGDVMEKRGVSYLEQVNANFSKFAKEFSGVSALAVEGKSISEVQDLIRAVLKV
jgi:thymidylate kinase